MTNQKVWFIENYGLIYFFYFCGRRHKKIDLIKKYVFAKIHTQPKKYYGDSDPEIRTQIAVIFAELGAMERRIRTKLKLQINTPILKFHGIQNSDNEDQNIVRIQIGCARVFQQYESLTQSRLYSKYPMKTTIVILQNSDYLDSGFCDKV